VKCSEEGHFLAEGHSVLRLGLLALVPFLGTDGRNLVSNPGLEEVKNGKPTHWALGGISDGGHATLEASTDRPHSGSYCARLKGDAEWAAVNSERIPIQRGKKYELRGYVRAMKGHGYVKFDYFRGKTYLGMTSDDFVTRNEWTLLTFTSETENYPSATHLTATLIAGDGEFDVCFDDISITEK
jgi:hypothetical protein